MLEHREVIDVAVLDRNGRAPAGADPSPQAQRAAELRSVVQSISNTILVQVAAKFGVSLGPEVERVDGELVITGRMIQDPKTAPTGGGGKDDSPGCFAICSESEGEAASWSGPLRDTAEEAWTDASAWVSQSPYRSLQRCRVLRPKKA